MVFNSDVFQRRCEILLYVCALWPRVLLSSWPHASPLCHLHSSLLLIHLQNCFCHDAMWWGGSPSTEGVHPWPRTYITHSNKNWRLPPPFFSDLSHSFALSLSGSKQRKGWTCCRPSPRTLSGRWTGRSSLEPNTPSLPSRWTRTKASKQGESTAPDPEGSVWTAAADVDFIPVRLG